MNICCQCGKAIEGKVWAFVEGKPLCNDCDPLSIGALSDEEVNDYYEADVERRFQAELARGRIEGKNFITATGAIVPAFEERPNDETMVPRVCLWCSGGMSDYAVCGNCGGEGFSGKEKLGIQRKEEWLDMIFFTDAERAELIDRDCCPDCGMGGGHDFSWECPNYRGEQPTEEEKAELYGEVYEPSYHDDWTPPDFGPPGSGAIIIEYIGNEPGLEDCPW